MTDIRLYMEASDPTESRKSAGVSILDASVVRRRESLVA